MSNKKNKQNGNQTYGIIGLGRFGLSLALELNKEGAELLVLDHDENKVQLVREFCENAFVVRNLEKSTLLETGIQNCDVAIVAIGEQIDTSLLTTLNLVEIGIPVVIAKATSSEHGRILERLGADVVYPERDMAIKLAHRLESKNVLDFVQLSKKLNISKILLPECMLNKSVIEINLRAKFGLNIIAIENNGDMIDNITPDYVFKLNDVLYLAGNKEALNKFNAWCQK